MKGTFNCRSLFTNKSHPISLTGTFICLLLICILPKCPNFSINPSVYLFIFLFIFLCNGDIERNPGPQKLKQNSPSICHWNLSSLSANNFSKHTQLKAYNSVYKHHFICLSETYLDSANPKNLLEIEGYNLIRADHLNNAKRGEVCIHIQKIALFSLILFSQISQTCSLIMEFMLHPDCHHQVVHASFNV